MARWKVANPHVRGAVLHLGLNTEGEIELQLVKA